jgi:two-component system OmpR family response regulator
MRLLVVEDAVALRESLVQGLTGLGYSVDATGDGEEGLWYALGNPYDLLLLDIMVPKVTGLEIIRKVRASEERAQTPILLLTARDEVEDRIAGLDTGADDYLTKPFAVGELLARVRALLRRGHQQAKPVLQVGDLVIDQTARQVRRGDADIPLTPREYALVEYLALRLGVVVARSELWEHLYDFASEPNSNAVDQLVSRLRRKLCPPGTPQLIATRRGFGYRLSATPSEDE